HLEVALEIANTIVAPTIKRMPSGTCSRRVAVRPGSCRIASVTRAPGAGQGQRASGLVSSTNVSPLSIARRNIRAANLQAKGLKKAGQDGDLSPQQQLR